MYTNEACCEFMTCVHYTVSVHSRATCSLGNGNDLLLKKVLFHKMCKCSETSQPTLQFCDVFDANKTASFVTKLMSTMK